MFRVTHHQHVENKAADAAAKEAASSTDMPPQPVSLSSALCCINRTILDPPIKHERTAAVYEKTNLLWDQNEVESRKDAVLLAQVQSGHCSKFKAYQHLIDPTVDPICPRCGEKPHTVEHWLTEWPGTEATWQEIFGSVSVPLSILTEEPGRRCWCFGASCRAAVSVSSLRQQQQQQ